MRYGPFLLALSVSAAVVTCRYMLYREFVLVDERLDNPMLGPHRFGRGTEGRGENT